MTDRIAVRILIIGLPHSGVQRHRPRTAATILLKFGESVCEPVQAIGPTGWPHPLTTLTRSMHIRKTPQEKLLGRLLAERPAGSGWGCSGR